MNKLSRLTALLLALIMLLGSISLAEDGLPIGGASGLTSDDWAALVDAAEEKLFFTDEGDTGKEIIPEAPEQPEMPASYPYTDVDEITLVQSETPADAYITASGAAILTHEAAGQWQFQADGVWATLPGETGATLIVTGAMLRGQKTGLVRKGLGEKNAETGEYAAYTQTAAVHIIESVPAMYSIARDAENTGAVSGADDGIMTLELANQENMVIIEVAYRISGTDQPVADSYVGQIAKKSALNTTLALPRVTGYQATGITVVPAELAENIAVFNAPSGENPGSVDLHVTAAHSVQDITIYVEYAPAEVNFTVRHMWQNAENDEYEQHEVETLTGLTGAAVGADRQKPYPGFSYIWYDPTTAIAADGSTVVEIRYNREYYLMTFDLGGGYGVEPIYARYGAPVSVDDPQRAGYDFAGWVDKAGNDATVPENMPAQDTELVALWTENTSKFIVAYWLDDPNKLDEEGNPLYNYWGSYEVTQYADGTPVKTGDKVRGEDYKDYAAIAGELDQYERRYSKFDHADAEVVVKGDGSTVVNVYYNRNEYTLKFYYALETKRTTSTGDEERVFSVVGGSTYNFGQLGNDVSALTNLENNYAGNSATGQVTVLPTLNAEGLRRNYVQGSDYSAATNYWFHYIQFSAKYGADISEKWPCSVFNSVTRQNRELEADGSYKNNWVGVEAHVSAWNGEHRVYYSQHAPNGNQTIKGNYNQLDYKLLYCHPGNRCDKYDGGGFIGHKEYEDSSTISYLCFWENGSDNVNWNVPKLFRYKIWVPIAAGQDISALPENEKIEKGDVQYYLRNVYDTCDNSTAGEQTAPAIEGFEYTGVYTTDTVDDYDDTVYQSAMAVNFYYTRNTYNLTFNNYGVTVKAESVSFDQDISYKGFEPPYPDNQEKGALEFVGWYTTPAFIAGTEFEFDTMPAHDVALYAKWELVWHEARFFHTKEEMEQYQENQGLPKNVYNVQHGKTLPEDDEDWWETSAPNPLDPNIYPNAELYEFAGWYYIDENGVEKRFDIDNMPITRSMNIYAKWTSDKPVAFVFRYVYIDADGTEIELALPTEGLALPFTPVTMSAKIGAELTNVPEGEDPLRYIPEVSSHTLNIQVDETKNEFVFEYSMPESVTYTVQYLEAVSVKDANGRDVLVPMRDGNGNLIHMADEKTVQTTKAVVTENYVPVSGYMPQATQLRLIVSTNEDANVIQFLYLPNPDEEYINATHILIDHENQKIIAGTDQNILGTIGQMEGVQKREYTGYAFSYAEVEVTVLNGTQVTTSTVPAADTSGNMVKHPLPNGGMHLYLYYTPVTYPYIVYHLDDQDRSKQLKDPTEGAALYGSTLTTSNFVQNIADYRAVSMTPAEIKVNVDDAANPTKNVMYIYYELDVADITITKNIAVSTEKDAPQPTQEELATAFTFQVLLKHATKQQTEVYVTLPEQDKQSMSLQNGVLTFTLQSGQSAIIHDLWGGTEYEVREIENAKFKTSYDAYSKGVLSSLDVHTVVTNTFPKYVGELTVKKTGMKDDKESAIVKAVVGNDVYYLVLNKSNGYTATISGIKPNTAYTVSEVTDWTWQYNSTVGQATGTITETQATATVTINNTRETDKWLHDESHVENNFGTGKSIGVNE